jgi:hypothetical protein
MYYAFLLATASTLIQEVEWIILWDKLFHISSGIVAGTMPSEKHAEHSV